MRINRYATSLAQLDMAMFKKQENAQNRGDIDLVKVCVKCNIGITHCYMSVVGYLRLRVIFSPHTGASVSTAVNEYHYATRY